MGNAVRCSTITKKDRENLATLAILKRKAEDLAEELRERLKEAEDINAPDENTERMWRGNQRKMEQLEEKMDQVTISIISEPSNDLGTEQRLQQELKQISSLRTTYSQLYSV